MKDSFHCLQVAFNDIKTQISNFLNEIRNANSRTFVGVAEMSGQTTNLANNRLGGYLNEIQPLIKVIQIYVKLIENILNLIYLPSLDSRKCTRNYPTHQQLLTRSTAGLLLEPAVLDIGDNLSPFYLPIRIDCTISQIE